MKFITEGEMIPNPKRKMYDWGGIAADLRKNPGQWGIIEPMEGQEVTTPEQAQSAAYRLKSGGFPGAAYGEFEATTRQKMVYGRYIGANGEYR